MDIPACHRAPLRNSWNWNELSSSRTTDWGLRASGSARSTAPKLVEEPRAGAYTAVWLGPDEWLVLSEADGRELVPELRTALGIEPGSVVDVSANRTAR